VSPTIFRFRSYRSYPDGEAKFWLEPVVSLAASTGVSSRRLRQMQRLVEERKNEIEEAWERAFRLRPLRSWESRPTVSGCGCKGASSSSRSTATRGSAMPRSRRSTVSSCSTAHTSAGPTWTWISSWTRSPIPGTTRSSTGRKALERIAPGEAKGQREPAAPCLQAEHPAVFLEDAPCFPAGGDAEIRQPRSQPPPSGPSGEALPPHELRGSRGSLRGVSPAPPLRCAPG